MISPCRADQIVVDAKPTDRGPATSLDLAVHNPGLFWLPPVASTQRLVYEYLDKNGDKNFTPMNAKDDYLHDAKNVEDWFSTDDYFSLLAERYQNVDRLKTNSFLSQDLHFAQYLSEQPSQLSRILGLRVAYTVTNAAKQKVQNPWLIARIYEGFLLPSLGEAYTVRWRQISQPHILEDASFAYNRAGELKNEVTTLQFLADNTDLLQEADWAKIQMARIQASMGHYQQAIALLKAVHSSDMKGVQSQIAAYAKLQAGEK